MFGERPQCAYRPVLPTRSVNARTTTFKLNTYEKSGGRVAPAPFPPAPSLVAQNRLNPIIPALTLDSRVISMIPALTQTPGGRGAVQTIPTRRTRRAVQRSVHKRLHRMPRAFFRLRPVHQKSRGWLPRLTSCFRSSRPPGWRLEAVSSSSAYHDFRSPLVTRHSSLLPATSAETSQSPGRALENARQIL
jgi:hypothetical protein